MADSSTHYPYVRIRIIDLQHQYKHEHHATANAYILQSTKNRKIHYLYENS